MKFLCPCTYLPLKSVRFLFWMHCLLLFFCSTVFNVDPLLSHPPPALFPPEPFPPHPYRNVAGVPFPIMLCLHLTHQTVAVPAARAPAQITTRQLIELFFSSQAGGHCKNIPTLEYGFLVQVRARGNMSPLEKALKHPVSVNGLFLRRKYVEHFWSNKISFNHSWACRVIYKCLLGTFSVLGISVCKQQYVIWLFY